MFVVMVSLVVKIMIVLCLVVVVVTGFLKIVEIYRCLSRTYTYLNLVFCLVYNVCLFSYVGSGLFV